MATVENLKDDVPRGTNLLRHQWLDKLWMFVFDGNSGGLMSPGQIRRERRNHQQVRQLEMEAILKAEGDINGIHQGIKALDDHGNLIDTPQVETVATHRVIENSAIEQGLDLGLETPASMIRTAVREVSVRDLERSLNIRKIFILAEIEILASEERAVSSKPVNAEWMIRWRGNAENAFHAESQLLWARILITELASPGTYSLGALAALRQLSHDDLQILRIIGKYAFPAFIYDAHQYFKRDTHHNWFEVMEDLGLLNHSTSLLDLKELPAQGGMLYLPCGNKALKVSGFAALKSVDIPIFKLTRIGRQLFPLAVNEADLAYVFELGRYLKEQGCEVEIGDWISADGEEKGQFVSKMAL